MDDRDVRDFEGVGDDAFGATDPDIEMKIPAEIEFRGDVLEADLKNAEEEAASWRDKALRAAAELDNYRKRVDRERAEERQRAGERIMRELLPVVDDLERAMDHAAPGDPLLDGVRAVYDKLQRVLESEGAEVIDPLGQPFDPHKHEAVTQRVDDTVPEHTVVEVFRKGYSIGDRIVRHAMVVVSAEGEAGK